MNYNINHKLNLKVNFLCISSYNNNLDWLRKYKNPHIIYDKTWNGGYKDHYDIQKIKPSGLQKKYPEFNIINADINGYNISDYFSYIIENFNNLPDHIVFMKGNTIGRHISEEKFKRVVNNKYFTCIEDYTFHDQNQKSLRNGHALLSCDGGWMEKNTSWYLRHHLHPTKYFLSYNGFINFCFKNPVLPKYLRFPPGACYIVSKEQIYKYNKIFYQNLKTFANHSRLSGEAHLIERSLYTIWNCDYEISENMKSLIDEELFNFPSKYKKLFFNHISKLKFIIRNQLM